MSEKLHEHEKHEEHEEQSSPELRHETRHSEERRNEKTVEAQEKSVDEIEHNIEKIHPSDSGELKKKFESPKEDVVQEFPPSRELKKVALSNTLSLIRSNLSKPEKTFSKLIHKSSINTISEFAGKTLIRPSGILVGGLFTLIGSAYYLYATKQTGYKYNFLVAILLFAGGFIFGVIIEILVNIARSHSSP
jgi:hypothetical protein